LNWCECGGSGTRTPSSNCASHEDLDLGAHFLN
jgi:hypothetical protein